jgi:2-oxoglutarate ferredoxin oxidoreductase subunit beta
MLAIARGSSYIERTAVNTPANILKTKKAISKAFRLQIQGYGFTLVEILSACPTNWKMDPVKSSKWIDEVMTAHFPLGVLKDISGDKKDAH